MKYLIFLIPFLNVFFIQAQISSNLEGVNKPHSYNKDIYMVLTKDTFPQEPVTLISNSIQLHFDSNKVSDLDSILGNYPIVSNKNIITPSNHIYTNDLIRKLITLPDTFNLTRSTLFEKLRNTCEAVGIPGARSTNKNTTYVFENKLLISISHELPSGYIYDTIFKDKINYTRIKKNHSYGSYYLFFSNDIGTEIFHIAQKIYNMPEINSVTMIPYIDSPSLIQLRPNRNHLDLNSMPSNE